MASTRKIAEGVMFFSSNTLILTALGFLTNIILVRVLNLYDYGLYILLLSFYSFMCLFLDFGLTGLITTETARALGGGNKEKAKGILNSYGKFVAALSITVFVLVLAGSYFIEDAVGRPLSEAVRVCAVFLLLTGVMNIFQTTFYAHSNFKYYVFMNVVQDATVFLLVFSAAYLGWGIGAYGAIVAYVIATSAAILLSYLPDRRTISQYGGLKGSGGEFRAMMKTQGGWVILTQAVGKIQENINPWIITLFLGVSEVALFSVAFKAYVFFRSLAGSFESTMMPLTSEEIAKDWGRTKAMLNRGVKYFTWLTIPLTAALALIAPWMITLVFTDKYLPAALLFQVLIISLLAYPIYSVFRPLFYALKAQKSWFYLTTVSTALGIVLNVGFMYYLGLAGMALSTAFHRFAIIPLAYYSTKRLQPDFGFDWRSMVTLDDFDRGLIGKMAAEAKKRFRV